MIAIIKYNAGNIRSVQNALIRIGQRSIVTDDLSILEKASKIILPGVGEASTAIQYLKDRKLDRFILDTKKPFLGICLGLQLMCQHSEESDTTCLGIFDTMVKKFSNKAKVPHMGWNNFEKLDSPLFEKVDSLDDVYYVHSYYADICHYTIATCDYITPFSSALQKDNYYATQFHPEKSASVGEQILKNFIKL